MADLKRSVPKPADGSTGEVIEEEGASAAKKAKGSEKKRKREPDEPQEPHKRQPGSSIGGEGGNPAGEMTQHSQQPKGTEEPMGGANSPKSQMQQPNMSAPEFLHEFHSFSEEQRSKILLRLNSPSDAGPSSAQPPAAGLPASSRTPETDAGISTTDPALPPSPSASPAPSPQTPAPLHAAPVCDASSIPMMDLSKLEEDLGVKHSSPDKKFDLPREKWQVATKADADGTTLLMKAAAEGALECTELLVRCGADVNARENGDRRRAIDFSLDGGHSAVSLLLFKWDSCFPLDEDEKRKETLETLLKNDDEIKALFQSRDEFHEKVMSGRVEAIDENPANSEDTLCGGGMKYWVNSEGHSALYTAAREGNFDAWAYLKSKKFEYVEEEKKFTTEMESLHKEDFDRAMEKYFVSVHKCHVYKMITKTIVFGCHGDSSLKVHAFYEDIDSISMTSQLLKCLQDVPKFEVIVDMGRADISCVYAGASSDTRGIMDAKMNRVYASAGEKEQSFQRRDVVSNIAHELAHKVMHVVFNNKGLPYRKEDEDNGRIYRGIVKRIMCSRSFKEFDEIIRRVANYDKELHDMEMIVRVPEMVSKYHLEGNGKDGLQYFHSEAKELLEFYTDYVMPEIERHVENNQFKNKMPAGDLLYFPELICDSWKTDIEVDNMEKAVTYEHNGVRYLPVSNLKLGLSHLIKSLENLVCIDWTKFVRYERYFQTQMSSGNIKKLAVVWDKAMGEAFCDYSLSCKFGCPARIVDGVKKQIVTLIIPKEFQLHNGEVKTLEYQWYNLSTKTKKWLLEKKVSFQGSEVTLKRLLEGVVGEGNAEGWMERNVSPGEICLLIDKEIVSIGRAVATPSNDREKALISGDHKECLISRRLRVRPVKFDRETFNSRKSDSFFIFGAEKKDLVEKGITEVSEWVSGRTPVNARCFFLPREYLNSRPQEDTFKRITGEMENIPVQGVSGEAWKFSHFFSFEGKSFQHLYSQSVGTSRTLILADDPGNGKSLYVKAKAMNDKSTNPLKWIQVIELGLHEEEIKKWKEENERNSQKEINLISRKEIEDSLSKLIFGRETSMRKHDEYGFENRIFQLSCHQTGKVIILLDGLDEVCPDHREKVHYFLKSLLENTKINVTVTTRVHESANLEIILDSIAYHLDPYESEEQLRFLEMEWKTVLESLPDNARDEKIQSIITNLESSQDIEKKEEISDLLQGLNNVMEKTSNIGDVSLRSVAERLVEIGEASVEGERDFTATPLNAWMAAEVFLGENFNFSSSFTLEKIYEKFIDKKINLFYVTEKVGASEGSVGKDLRETFRNVIYASLKKLSASFFLKEAKYRVEKNDIQTMIRVGLVVEREGLNVFVHRTIGEYMLSLWLLDGKAEVKTMMKVLLEKEFHQVRRFLEGQLSSFKKQGSSESGEGVGEKRISLMNPTKFPSKEDAIISFRKCLYLSIANGTIGIMQSLIESFGEYGECVVYEKAEFDIRELNLRVHDSYMNLSVERGHKTTAWNAFTLFGNVILGNVRIRNERTTTASRIQCLRLLSNYLNWIKGKGNFIGRFEGVLTDQNLMWMGFGVEDLWKEEEGRKQFELLLEFLIGVKSVFGESVKKALMYEESESLFKYAAEYSIKSFVPLLDTYLKKSDFDDLLLPSSQNSSLIMCNNVVCAWTTVARWSGVEGLQLFWDWLRSKMETPEKMKRFLRREDGKGKNALYASFCNEKYPNVFAHVWKLCGEVFDESEGKEYLFNTFSGVESKYGKLNKFAFFDWIIVLLISGFLNEGEVARLFLSKDKDGDYYLLDLYSRHITPFPSQFSKVQRLFFERLPSKEEIVRNMRKHYITMTRSCFESSSWMGVDVEFECEVESAFEAMRPSILSFPPFRGFRLDGEGNLVGVVHDDTEKRVNVIRFKAFGVLLRRQVEMEQGVLGREEAMKRLKREWGGMLRYFPDRRIEGREGEKRETRELFVRFTFAVLSELMTKEEIAGILLGSDYYNPLYFALDWPSDSMAFLAQYDIARWCVAEDALWRVHALEWGGITVLESLLRRQEGGDFARIEDFLRHENASPEASISS